MQDIRPRTGVLPNVKPCIGILLDIRSRMTSYAAYNAQGIRHMLDIRPRMAALRPI